MSLSGAAKLLAFFAGGGHGLDARDVGIVGIDAAQAIERLIGQVVRPGELQIFRKTLECFSIRGRGEQNLLPELNGHVGPAAGFEGAGFFSQCGAIGVSGVGDRRLLRMSNRERQHEAARYEKTRFPDPQPTLIGASILRLVRRPHRTGIWLQEIL